MRVCVEGSINRMGEDGEGKGPVKDGGGERKRLSQRAQRGVF